MRLQNQWHALDRSGVGVFTTFGEPLFEEFLRVGEWCDAAAGVALAAKVVLQSFAVRGLCEHPRQREFADSARSSEEQRVWNALGSHRAAQSRDDVPVAQKVGEAHVSGPPS